MDSVNGSSDFEDVFESIFDTFEASWNDSMVSLASTLSSMTLMKSTTSNRSKWHRIASIRDVYLLTLNAIVVCYGSLVNPRVTSKVCRHQIVQVCLCRFKNNRLFNPETKRPVRGNIWSSARNVLACQLPAIFHWTVALKIQSLLLKIQVAAVVNQPIEFPTAAQFHLFKPMARP